MGTTEIVALVVAVVGSTGLWNFLQSWLTKRKQEESVERKALQSILMDRLHQAYIFHSNKGYCTLDDKQRFDAMYQAYHNLGKNGVMTEIYNDIMDMPVTKKEDVS